MGLFSRRHLIFPQVPGLSEKDEEVAHAIETGTSLTLEDSSNAPPGFGESSVKDISGHLESQTGVSVAEQALAEPTPQNPPSTNNRPDGTILNNLIQFVSSKRLRLIEK